MRDELHTSDVPQKRGEMAAPEVWVAAKIGFTELLITHCFAVVVWQLICSRPLCKIAAFFFLFSLPFFFFFLFWLPTGVTNSLSFVRELLEVLLWKNVLLNSKFAGEIVDYATKRLLGLAGETYLGAENATQMLKFIRCVIRRGGINK